MKQINMLLIMTLMLCGGCMSIYQRAVSEHKDGLYYPTIIEFAGICHLLDQGESDEPCDYLRGMSALSIPFIIDLPFTAAADTVCLPYDFFKSNNKKGEQNE